MNPIPSSSPVRVPFYDWLKQYGRTRATGHRWRRLLPWLDVQNIFGRLYISIESVRRFEEAASRGELAIYLRPPEPRRRPARHAVAPRPIKFGPPRKKAKGAGK
jgi:hypothetical protein